MSNHANLTAAILFAMRIDADAADEATVASALADILVAFADLVRGPAPVCAELAAVEQAAEPAAAELLNQIGALVEEIRSDRRARARTESR
jgi:hypothetical protein